MPTRIAPDTWRIEVPVAPAGMAPPFTNCVVIVDGEDVHLIDAGEDTDAAFAAVVDGVRTLGLEPERIRTATSTHMHRDHCGLPRRLRERFGTEILLHRLEQESLDAGLGVPRVDVPTLDRWGVPEARRPELLQRPNPALGRLAAATVLLEDGDRLPIAGRDVRVVHTPGHTPGHIAVVEAETGLLMTGDLVLFDQFPGIGLGGRPYDALGAYLGSLGRLPLEAEVVVPGHGEQDRPLAERIEEIRRHHGRRTAEAAEIRASIPEPTVWEVARRISWSRGWEGLHGFTLRSALTQVDLHLRLLDARASDAGAPGA